jgi:hypothetical protein
MQNTKNVGLFMIIAMPQKKIKCHLIVPMLANEWELESCEGWNLYGGNGANFQLQIIVVFIQECSKETLTKQSVKLYL